MMITSTSFNAAVAATTAASIAPVAPAAPTQQARPAAAAPPLAPSSADAAEAVTKVAQEQAARDAVAALNQRLEPMNTSVRFELDNSTGKTVITMLDTENNNVVRQFPSEDTLAMIRALDHQQGVLINTTS